MDNRVIDTIRKYFETKPVEKVWIFGSFSRGEELPDSDVDIIISLISGVKFSLLDHATWIYELEDLLSRKVDLVKEGTLLSFAEESANNDKILVYERAA